MFRLTISLVLACLIAVQPILACQLRQSRHDTLNRISKTVQPQSRTTEYGYDKNSNLATVKDPKGQTTVMTFDALDRLATASHRNAESVEQVEYQYNYDAEDNLWRVFDARGANGTKISTRAYDRRNRLSQTKDANGRTVDYSFDAANNLKTLTAAGKVTSYDYDAKNQLDRVAQAGLQVADYDYFADGLLEKVSYQNGTTRNFGYDDADRVTAITQNFVNNQTESFTYGYDPNSNRTSEVKKANGQAFRTINYDYDKLDRLTSADYTANVPPLPNPPVGEQIQYVENTEQNRYGYDAVGNRTSEINRTQTKTVTLSTDASGNTTRSEQTSATPDRTTTAQFNELNELTQLTEPSGISTFAYDLNGILKEVSKGGAVLNRYEYDIRNQLTKVRDGANNEVAGFDYDFERKRTSKTSANATTNYVYAGNQVVSEFQGASLAAHYAIGAGEVIKSEFSNGENSFHYTDALGSVTHFAAPDGSLTTRNEYDAFGVQSQNGATNNAVGYTGQRLDAETGLMALGNGERYYSPNYARFIQVDALVKNLREQKCKLTRKLKLKAFLLEMKAAKAEAAHKSNENAKAIAEFVEKAKAEAMEKATAEAA